MSLGRLLVFAFIFLLILLIPVIVGIYVFRDARKRGMQAALWTLVAVLTPSLIGFLVYLLVRENYAALKCAKCGTAVKPDYVLCPGCGTRLRATCGNCSSAVEQDWIVCPKCASPLVGRQESVSTPVQPRDRAIKKILLLIILIPVSLLILLIGAIIVFSVAPGGSSSSFMEMTAEAYFKEQDNAIVEQWYQDVSDQTYKAAVLRYTQALDNGKETAYRYLVWIPGADPDCVSNFANSHGFRKDVFRLELEDHTQDGQQVLYGIAVTAEKNHYLELIVNGETIPFELIDVEFDPTFFSGAEGGVDVYIEEKWEIVQQETVP